MTEYLSGQPKYRKLLARLLPECFVLIIIFLLIRGYEVGMVYANHVLPAEASIWFAKGLLLDLTFVCFVVIIFAGIAMLTYRIGNRTGRYLFRFLGLLLIISYVGVTQYFAYTLLPAGRDIFEYSAGELSDTILTSVSISVEVILPFVLFSGAYLGMAWWFQQKEFSRHLSPKLVGGIALLALGFWIIKPDGSNFRQEIEYNLIANKAQILVGSSLSEVFSLNSSFGEWEGEEYPLLKTAEYDDVLGPFLKSTEEKPNIVFIVVEGLGRAFAGPDAQYGGFTPFLDSLSRQGLWFENMLSSSGRSFGLHPALFGSLPFGQKGFMELRADMPEHHSLISLLNDNGYHTSYFCGYDSHFDFIDVFLERQNIDQIHDISGFDSEYTKMDAIEGGFTWGYSDQDLFNQSFKILDAQPATNPRLDIYFTLNLHEPFIIPEKQSYLQRVETKMPKLDLSAEQQEIYSNYKEVFASLLYTDEAIQNFINEYKKRPEYENTIFVITGDHRLIPIPHRSKIDRYRVFFAIHSPLLNTSEHFASVSTHFNVTPTLLGYLQKNHNLSLPERTHWIGNTIDTARTFRNVHSIPLMRNKNQLLDYLHEDHFLAENQLFKLHEGLGISPINSQQVRADLSQRLQQFKSVNRYVTRNNKILPASQNRERYLRSKELVTEMGLYDLDDDTLFWEARSLAIEGKRDTARAIARVVLERNPGSHDVRTLLGRSYAWDQNYESAREQLREVIRRNPNYLDAYSALLDIALWNQNFEQAVSIADEGLAVDPQNTVFLQKKMQALEALEQPGAAQKAQDQLNNISGN